MHRRGHKICCDLTDRLDNNAMKPAGQGKQRNFDAKIPIALVCVLCRRDVSFRWGNFTILALQHRRFSSANIQSQGGLKTQTGKIDGKQQAHRDSCDQCAFDRLCV